MKKIRIVAAALLLSTLCMPAAHAGFVWTPPPAPPMTANVTANGPPMAAAPVMPVEASATGGMDTLPLPPAGTPPTTKPDNLASFLPPGKAGGAGDYMDVQGFGKDLPLHIVAKQIVPAGFTVNFALGVDTDTPVSWNGGRPWNVTLQDALMPVGLRAAVNGQTVTIQSANAANAMPSPAPESAMTATMDSNATDAPIPLATTTAPPPVTGSTATEDIHWNTSRPGDSSAPIGDAALPAPMANNEANNDMNTTAPMPSVGMRPGDISSIPMEAPAVNDNKAAMSPVNPAMEMPANTSNPVYMPPPSTTAAMPPMEAPAPQAQATQAPAPVENQQSVANDVAPPIFADTAAMPPVENIAASDLTTVNHWQAVKGDSLHNVLSDWCARAGVELIWQADRDYTVRRATNIRGNFTEAVMRMLTVYDTSKPRPTGALHPHAMHGQAVLVISTPSGFDASY